MSVSLPNGITWAIAATYASSLTVTAASNASECVLTVTNTLVAGDFVEFTSGWSLANGRVFRVKSPSGTQITLEGFNTSSTSTFPAGSGTGSIRKIATWTQVSQMVNLTSSGGEAQYLNYSFLEDSYERTIPTTTSAQTLSFEIADDPSLAGQQAISAAAQSRAVTALKGVFPQSATSAILYNCIFSFDDTPSMNKNQLMTCKGGAALQGRPVRYAS